MIVDLIDRIRFLSQEEGLWDGEIAEQLGCHRVTVTRARQEHHIPRPDLQKRKDKKQVCKRCNQVTYIRRCQRVQKYCGSCRPIIRQELLERKRVYMQSKKKKHSAGMLPNAKENQ